jgi:PKD repeat protein
MLRPLRFFAWPLVLGIALAAGMGCPTTPPNYLASFLFTPSSLDFGSVTKTLTVKIAKNYTQQPLPQFTVTTGGTPWLGVTPGSGNSTGPNDRVEFTVTVDRTKMAAGPNSANLIVSAPGVADQKIPVTATARLVADFSADPLLTTVNKKVTFTDESQVAPGEGQVIDWLWSFGDGSTSTDPNPTHRYKESGTYTVSLTAANANVVDTAVKQNYITVEGPGGPDADFFTIDVTPPANTPVQFMDSSDSGGSTIKSRLWTFGDPLNSISEDKNPAFTYTTPGKYTVSLTITTNSNESDTETKLDYIDVQPVGPTANFVGIPRTISAGQSVNFSDISDPGTSPISSWVWLFGDGTSSGQSGPTHVYSAAGSYTVYLAVTTQVGSAAVTKTNYITVTPAP